MSNPLYFVNRIVRPKRHSYDFWWDSPVDSYDPELWECSNGQVTHGMYVRTFYNALRDIIINKGYSIKDEKRFKNEIATFIYHLSTEYNE